MPRPAYCFLFHFIPLFHFDVFLHLLIVSACNWQIWVCAYARMRVQIIFSNGSFTFWGNGINFKKLEQKLKFKAITKPIKYGCGLCYVYLPYWPSGQKSHLKPIKYFAPFYSVCIFLSCYKWFSSNINSQSIYLYVYKRELIVTLPLVWYGDLLSKQNSLHISTMLSTLCSVRFSLY